MYAQHYNYIFKLILFGCLWRDVDVPQKPQMLNYKKCNSQESVPDYGSRYYAIQESYQKSLSKLELTRRLRLNCFLSTCILDKFHVMSSKFQQIFTRGNGKLIKNKSKINSLSNLSQESFNFHFCISWVSETQTLKMCLPSWKFWVTSI